MITTLDTKNFFYHPEGYCWYILPDTAFKDLPDTVTIYGDSFRLKDEFHVTIINSRKIARELDDERAKERMQPLLREYISSGRIKFIHFGEELRLAVTNERKSIAAPCVMEGVEDYFREVSRMLNAQIPIQPTHVSLYTYTGKAVGIDTVQEMEGFEKIEIPEVQKAVKDITL